MKKREFILVASILTTLIIIVGSIQAGNIQTKKPTESLLQTNTVSYQFSQPSVKDNNDFVTLQINEVTNYRNIPGEPILPVVMKTLELPFGTLVNNVRCTITGTHEIQLIKKIAPATKPVPIPTQNQIVQPIENAEIYTKNQFFPDNWYSYRLTGGLNKDNILKTFLTIQVNPVRYNPVVDRIQSLDTITIDITYEQPLHPFSPLSDAYDLVIICYNKYAPLLQFLVAHKNSHGVQTKLVTINDIKGGTYFPVEGRDIQEKIKYFIKNAKETWNITYVMLVGNYVQVPVRYSYLETDKGSAYEELRFASDLYYADLYNANGSFCSWDTDNDGIYAEWPYPQPPEDKVDLAPDVYVGRLACMFKSEVKTMVDKIITYENTTAGKDWFNRMVVAGGDTYDKSEEGGTNYTEGETVTGKALEIMPQFTPVKLWTSLGNLTTKNIHNEISEGCGFLFFAGHGSPNMWATHNNSDYRNWTGEFSNSDMVKLSNKDMYPILLVGGCHNSEIDVTPINIIRGFLKEKFHYFSTGPNDFGSFWLYNWVPECWSWVFVKARGGAIASIGSCGYGCDQIGDGDHDGIPDCTQYYDGWLELEFFRLYNQQNITILGQTYYQDVTGYINNFPVDTNRYDAKVLETHILLGDPSLKIGGYQ
ncbi:MAG: hypothetical protein IMZ43_11655 [Thermoplasmata archaeon]|nr:hypothetical protein [Thermoplasmata archaeon]